MSARRAWLALLAGWLAVAVLAAPALAQGGAITASNSKVESKFSEYVRYRISLKSDSDITSATVFVRYITGDSGITTTRGKADITPGKDVTAVFTRTLQRGDLVPGTDIEYYWQIENAAGQTLKTETARYVFPDDRFDFKSMTAPVGKGTMTVFWYGADDAYGKKRLDVAVAAIQNLQQRVGVDLNAGAKIFIYRTRNDMLAALPFKGQTNEASLTVLGQLSNPTTVLLLGGDSGVDNTTYHELSHLVVHLATTNSLIGGVSIPAWLDEGLSMYNQLNVESPYTDAVQRALRADRLISVRSLSAVPGQSDQVIQFYGQSYYLVKYLNEKYGKDKMLKLLDTFKRGTLVDDALKQTYGFGVQGLDDQIRDYLGAAPREAPAAPTQAPGAVVQPTPAPTAAAPATGSNPPASGGSGLPAICACLAPSALGLLWWLVALRRAA
ncbi:MAG: hypothetical protein HZB53_21075 [Chloroflexi bacterium]|nr:hypothetical protein [Chloroflexota bacterium]